MVPSTRYADSDGASIAYQVAGDGPLDILFLPGWISQIEQLWEAPVLRRFLERLTGFSRLILFDSRGTGLSERVLENYSLEQEAHDAITVLDAVGSERTALFTYAAGGLVGATLAARHPQRVGALIMYASVARTSWATDYEWAMTSEERETAAANNTGTWGELDNALGSRLAPSSVGDPSLAAWFARTQRLAASPREARTIAKATASLDVRDLLPEIRVPTLIMHRPKCGTCATRDISPSTSPARATSSSTAKTRSRSSATATP
jgi:pimeloyl-ACP methyl ester carboxylesterase